MLRHKQQIMGFKHIYLFPLILSIGLCVTVIITYSMSLSSHHVKAIFPYISDTGTWPPESCIFSLMLFIFSTILGFINYARYKQINIYCETVARADKKALISKLNKVSLWCGFISCSGMVMVASFQETNLFWVHVVGANNTFGVGCIFQWLQTAIAWNLYPEKGSRTNNIIKVILSVISTFCLLCFEIFGMMALLRFRGDNITLWGKDDGGYSFHITSTITEWILTISTMLYFTTYIKELKELVIVDFMVIEVI